MTEPEATSPAPPEPRLKKRNSFVVGFLSLLMTGFGHIYIGEARRGLFLFLLEFLLGALFFATTVTFSSAGMLFLAAALLLYQVAVVIDSVVLSRRKGHFELKGYNRFLSYLGLYLGMLILSAVLSTVIQAGISRVKAYKIPAPSMVPTFIVGDHILIDRWAYGENGPQRGDLIVFRFPKNKKIDFIKRCVAVEGDTLEIRDKALMIDGVTVEEPHAAFFDTGSIIKGRDNFGPYTVPAGKVFTLGDNRDNSNDSRFWGPVDIEEVRGKVKIIYWSWDKENSTVRWERIGREFE